MRYMYACFENYIGFYNGLGLDKVEIDFTRGKNKIVLISGSNGCGKSTLLNALNIFPDPYSAFVPNKPGKKLLSLFDNGDRYDIQIISGWKNNKRETTKAFIQKNGLELNSNGNVSSYKEIIFSEFDLDSNFSSLSRLSANDRGLGDKTPSERKKFVSRIIDNLEVYNDIYKTLNKKSLVFKSHINNIHTKIQNIGNKENLELELKKLRDQEIDIKNKILNLNNLIVSIKTKVSIDEKEAEKINHTQAEYNHVQKELQIQETKLKELQAKTKITQDQIELRFKNDDKLKEKYENDINNLTNIWKDKSNQLKNTSDSLNNLEAELLNTNIDEQLEKKYQESNLHIQEILQRLKVLKVPENTNLVFVIEEVVELYDSFINYIDRLYEKASAEMLDYLCFHDDHKIEDQMEIQNGLVLQLEKWKNKLDQLNNTLKDLAVLENRPDGCKIDNCPFIKSALQSKLDLGDQDITEEINQCMKSIDSLNKAIEDQGNYINKLREFEKEYNDFHSMMSKIQSYSKKLNSIGEVFFSDFNNVLHGISNMSLFNDIRDTSRLVEARNLLLDLKSEKELNQTLKIQYTSQREKIQLINSSRSMIEKLKLEKDKLLNETMDYKNKIDKSQALLNTLKSNLHYEEEYYLIYKDHQMRKQYFESVSKELESFRSKSEESLEQYSHIKEYQVEIENYNKQLLPIENAIQRISGQLTLLASYYEEYSIYKEKYNMIEVLKKYCSPTGGGIQTLFMQLYMSKTLTLSNQILQMLFGGEYQLLDFVINQSEFRIPFVGSGLPVDDISNGSASQVCMMSMIINLVLLHQASTKFNIAQLDEMDHALDSRNRSEFVNILYAIIPMLEIDQLFVISHSIEANASLADVIRLKTYSDFDDNTDLGNVIYDYEKEIQKL